MDIIIGIGILLILIAIIIFEVSLVRSINKLSEPVEKPKIEEKPQKAELSEEQKKKQEELRKNFDNLMGYGYEQALKSSKGE